jgi:hypothetical protein
MKSFNLDIHPELKNVTITVKNGRKFSESLIKGQYANFEITVDEEDLNRVKDFAVKKGNDNDINKGNWYAHCNGYAMDLCVMNKGQNITINTYRPYGKTTEK